jgi:hypothetical protein
MDLTPCVKSPNYQSLAGTPRLLSPSCHLPYPLRAPRIAVLPLREGRLFKIPRLLTRLAAHQSADLRADSLRGWAV